MNPILLTDREKAQLCEAAAALITYPDGIQAAENVSHQTLDRAGEKLSDALGADWSQIKAATARLWQTSSHTRRRDAIITAERAIAIVTREHRRTCCCLLCSIALPALRAVLPEERWTTEWAAPRPEEPETNNPDRPPTEIPGVRINQGDE